MPARDESRRSRVPWRFVAACTVGLAIVCGARIVVQLHWGRVTGLDTGNWLTFGHQWLGNGLADGTASLYPPVVPVTVTLLTLLAGPLTAFIVVGALATAAHGGCLAAVLWRAGCGWWSLPLAVAVAAGTAVGETVAWGGGQQILGLGLGLLVLYLLGELLVTPRPALAWTVGALLLGLGATSHLILAAVATVAAAMVALRFTSPVPRPTWARLRTLALLAGRVLAPSLLLLPLYLRLLSTVGDSVADRRDSQTVSDFLYAVDLTIRELPELWRPALLFVLLLPVVLLRHRREPLWLVTAGLAVFLFLVAVVNPEPRFAYLVPLTVATGLGLLVAHGPRLASRRLRRALTAAVLLALSVSTVRALVMFDQQAAYYGRLVPAGSMTALEELRATTEPGDQVVVPPVAGLPFGWWVEGYGRRPATVGSAASWLNFPEERERAATAVRLFSASDVFSDRWFADARDEGIDAVYVPATFEGLPERRLRELRRERPDLVLYDGPAALIVAVP